MPSGLPLSHILLPNPPPLCSGFVQNSVATVIVLSAHFSLSCQLTLKGGFSLTVVSVSIHLIFLPSLLLFLIILLILSTDQCRASAKHGCPFYLAHAAASLQCQGVPDEPCPFFFARAHFFFLALLACSNFVGRILS